MKFDIPKEWIAKRAHLEDGCEIGAGCQGLSASEWEELGKLDWNDERAQQLIKKTYTVDEHPEDYDGPCMCQLCQSYTDI